MPRDWLTEYFGSSSLYGSTEDLQKFLSDDEGPVLTDRYVSHMDVVSLRKFTKCSDRLELRYGTFCQKCWKPQFQDRGFPPYQYLYIPSLDVPVLSMFFSFL